MKRFISRTAAFTLAILAVITWSASGCNPSPKQAGPREKITIGFPTTPNAIIVCVAFAKGYFAEEGLDVTPQPHAFGKLALNAMIDGKADLAVSGDTPIVFAIMNGSKIATIATVQTSNRSVGIVARRDRGIEKPADLRGKSIGVTRETTGDFFVYSFLLFYGVDGKLAKQIDMKPDEMAEALRTGRVDAVSTWPPYLKQLQEGLGGKGVLFSGGMVYTEFFCVSGRQDFLKKNPETTKKVLRALIRAETFVKERPDESSRLVAGFLKMDKADLDAIWGKFSCNVSIDQALVLGMEEQIRWLARIRSVAPGDVPKYLDFLYVDGLASVRPDSVRMIR